MPTQAPGDTAHPPAPRFTVDPAHATFTPDQRDSNNTENYAVGQHWVMRSALVDTLGAQIPPANITWTRTGDAPWKPDDGSIVIDSVRVCSATESCAYAHAGKASSQGQGVIPQAPGAAFMPLTWLTLVDNMTESYSSAYIISSQSQQPPTLHSIAYSEVGNIDVWPQPSWITWTSANPSVASVSSSGVITAGTPGTTTVHGQWGNLGFDITVHAEYGVLVSGADYARNQNVTATAMPLPAGSYTYKWYIKFCQNSTAAIDCDGQWHLQTSGYNLTSFTDYVSENDYWFQFKAEIYDSAGNLLASGTHYVDGEGLPKDGGCGGTMC
ncbi:MAG TPA: Ig-like domain-containing protein [Longimicrobiaceae bacterium]